MIRNIANLLLAIWLIATGVLSIVDTDFPGRDLVMAILAIASGIFILLDRKGSQIRQNLGRFVLAIWLIAIGLLPLLNLSFPADDVILAILAIIAGLLILFRK